MLEGLGLLLSVLLSSLQAQGEVVVAQVPSGSSDKPAAAAPAAALVVVAAGGGFRRLL